MTEAPTQKIKICLVCPKAYPVFNEAVSATFGGAEVDLYYLGTELAKDPHFEVCCVVADYGQPDVETRENVTLIKSLDFRENALVGAWKIWQALRKADAALYLMKSISAGLFELSLFCRLYRRKLVYRTAHSTHCDGSYRQKKPLMGRLFVRTLKQAALVFTQNQSDASHLRRLYGIDSVTVPNAHRIKSVHDTERQSILWVGRSADFKHPRRFFELAQAFGQERFVMICQPATGDSHYGDLKKDAGAIANLEFMERVPFHEIDEYFERAKVFVNTSDSEGFPNTFIQACKAGSAILSSVVNPDGFLDTHGCGLAGDGTMEKTIEQLRFLLEGERFLEYGSRGREYVRATHDIETIIETYTSLFQGLGRD